MNKELKSPFIGITRHRIQTDGDGVTTLAAFHGCPLNCRYCLNPQSLAFKTPILSLTPFELYERVKVDQLYFLASGGGITFGGGEPLLYSDFIVEFRALCGPQWKINIETSLNVPWDAVQAVSQVADYFIIDCKDTDPLIYERYTGRSNSQMLENLHRLVSLFGAERIKVRVPLIPEYNSNAAQQRSIMYFEKMGLRQIDIFTYKTDIKKTKKDRDH